MKSYPLENIRHLDPLLAAIGDARVVMLGEASHGTSEYYNWRTVISRRLIEEKGFNFIAVEGDWPDCYAVNRYIKHYEDGGSPREVLGVFQRWPTWMWGNWEVAALIHSLHRHNSGLPAAERVGFYGLDVYSLYDSLQKIIDYLQQKDPAMLAVAQAAFLCFEPYYENPQGYALATRGLVPVSCQEAVVEVLRKIQDNLPAFADEHESSFNQEQNARVAVNAEAYYRAMLQGGGASWNVRDRHMDETLARLLDWHGPDSKAIIWAHNTHVGDARATDMARARLVNIGQLARERYGDKQCFLVGMGSYQGTVVAGEAWGAPQEVMNLPPARPGSWEDYLYQAGRGNQLIFAADIHRLSDLQMPVDHRAVGVVYNPATEAFTNYVPSWVNERYDAFLFFPESRALHALDLHADADKLPETFPWSV